MTAAAPRQIDLNGIVPRLRQAIRFAEPRPLKGRVRRVVGIIVHASVSDVRIGEICELRNPRSGRSLHAEVVGFLENGAVLTPIGELTGISMETEVIPTGEELTVPVGPELLGRVISPLGEPLDGIAWSDKTLARRRTVHADPPLPLERDLIEHPLQLGIRAIDGLLTVARGQRIGIFGESGVGKSTLLASIVRGTEADIVVLGLIGERGREVHEFIERQLGRQGRAKSVAVVSTSDRPATERVKAAHTATSIAEYFRDQGHHVLLLMDSVTRFARAQREIGLAAGEPPTRRGFPPSLFAALPRLLERTGPGRGGSITALYTVLVEGDGTLDPIAEEVQAILDGHIVLSSELAQRNHFPAIDVLRSRSRLMDTVASPEHRAAASRVRDLLARYADIEILVRVGEYKTGADPKSDEALAKIDQINAFLRQPFDELAPMPTTVQRLQEIAA
jgi:ATP synthase in type III secretion protein N